MFAICVYAPVHTPMNMNIMSLPIIIISSAISVFLLCVTTSRAVIRAIKNTFWNFNLVCDTKWRKHFAKGPRNRARFLSRILNRASTKVRAIERCHDTFLAPFPMTKLSGSVSLSADESRSGWFLRDYAPRFSRKRDLVTNGRYRERPRDFSPMRRGRRVLLGPIFKNRQIQADCTINMCNVSTRCSRFRGYARKTHADVYSKSPRGDE